MLNTIKTILGLKKAKIRETRIILSHVKPPTIEQNQDVALRVEINRQIIKLKKNEEKAKNALYFYLKRNYLKQGLLPTEKQLQLDTIQGWKNLKESKLVDGFNNFVPAIEEILLGE